MRSLCHFLARVQLGRPCRTRPKLLMRATLHRIDHHSLLVTSYICCCTRMLILCKRTAELQTGRGTHALADVMAWRQQ